MSQNMQPSNTNDALVSERPDGDSDKDILARARADYKASVAADSDWRANAVDDLNFLPGGEAQWDPAAVAARKADGRPVITVNQLPTFLHQVTNDQRMNTPSIHIHPVGSGADEETAKIRQGMIRHIEYDSNADIAYDRSVNSSAAIGAGYWYLDTQYVSPTSFDQKIMFRSISNMLSVRTDPLSTEPDGSDFRFAFIESVMARDDFKREWPEANANDPTWLSGGEYAQWLQPDTVLVAMYYCIECEWGTVVQLSNGETGWKDKLLELPLGVEIVRERRGERKKVMLYKITGVDVLERTEIKMSGGAWIPVFPVYGDEVNNQGKINRWGIIRNAKGPCQSYNVMMSGATEEVSLRTKAPYIGAEGQFEGYEDDWAQANRRAFPYLEYVPVTIDGNQVGAPQRQPMADIPAGMIAMAMHAADNVKKTTGLFDASLGARGTATSGKQELAQQREGDVANYHFTDNLNRSVLHCGRVINAMIPHYYDAERVIQIMRPDDTVESATINQQLPGPIQDKKTGAIKTVLNDMTGGEFSVTVSAGPSYSTQRQESQEFFTNAMQAAKDPATNAIVTYLAMQNSDAPGADIATKMIKTLLPPPAAAVLDEDKDEEGEMVNTPRGPVPAAQIPQILAQLEQQLQQASEAIDKSQADKQASEAAKAQSEVLRQQNEAMALQLDAQRVQIEQYNAETERQKAEAEAIKAHEDSINAADANRIEEQQKQLEMIQAQLESQKEDEEKVKPVSIEDMAQLIIKSRPEVKGMQIKAPSGGVYEVAIQ